MDADSPFARFAPPTTGAKKPTSIGWRYFGTMVCSATKGGCGHEWNVPVEQGGARASACPKCHQPDHMILKDGSVQEAPPTRPW